MFKLVDRQLEILLQFLDFFIFVSIVACLEIFNQVFQVLLHVHPPEKVWAAFASLDTRGLGSDTYVQRAESREVHSLCKVVAQIHPLMVAC